MTFIEHEHMIQALPSQGSHKPFGNRIGLRRPHRGTDLLYPETMHPPAEFSSVDAIPVTNQIAGRLSLEAGVHDLLPGPSCGMMLRHPYMHNLPCCMMNQKEHIRYLKRQRPHREEIARPEVLGMLGEEILPVRRGRSFPRPSRVLPDRPWRDDKPEPQQLCHDAPLAPEGIFFRHPADQLPYFKRYPSASRFLGARLPAPVGTPTAFMPPQYGLGLDDHQTLPPAGKPAAHQNPESPVAMIEAGTFFPAREHRELLAQAHNLRHKHPTGAEHCRDDRHEPAHGILPVYFLWGRLSIATKKGASRLDGGPPPRRSEQLAKFPDRHARILDDAGHGIGVDGVSAGDGQKVSAVGHYDVLALADNAKAGL